MSQLTYVYAEAHCFFGAATLDTDLRLTFHFFMYYLGHALSALAFH